MLDHYNTYGYLPIWQLWGQDNYCMIGNHAVPVVADAVMKGADGIDPKRAWNAVKGSVTKSHPGSPFDVWNRYGYMPEEIQSQSVSITLEDSFDDWCVAQVAKFLGKENEHEFFAKRAGNYKNLFREDIGFCPERFSWQLDRTFRPAEIRSKRRLSASQRECLAIPVVCAS